MLLMKQLSVPLFANRIVFADVVSSGRVPLSPWVVWYPVKVIGPVVLVVTVPE